MAADTFTTNIHEPRELGVLGGRRVKLTVDDEGTLVWCELFDPDGQLRGCGPSLAGLGGRLLDIVRARLDCAPPRDFPLYWRRLLTEGSATDGR